MSGIALDLRFALRSLFRSPGFAVVAIVTLALGIGANTAIFSFANALLLRDLPVHAPEKLVWVGMEFGEGRWANTLGWRFFELLRTESEAFSGSAAESGGEAALTVAGESEQVSLRLVSGNYFQVLGVPPATGRLLQASDDDPGAEPAAVLRHAYWRSRFGSDPAVVGSNVRLAGRPYRVVGIAAPDFLGTNVEYANDVWAPISDVNELRGGTFNYLGLDSSCTSGSTALGSRSWAGSRPECPSSKRRRRLRPCMRGSARNT